MSHSGLDYEKSQAVTLLVSHASDLNFCILALLKQAAKQLRHLLWNQDPRQFMRPELSKRWAPPLGGCARRVQEFPAALHTFLPDGRRSSAGNLPGARGKGWRWATQLLQSFLCGRCQGLQGVLLKDKMQWLKGTRSLPCKALHCEASRSLRNPSPAAPGGGEVLFFKLPELSTACPLLSMLVRSPAWFSEAMLMPYVYATEAFYCLCRGT